MGNGSMLTKIGHFEILSELSKSATGAVYKANDPQTNQTVALKAIHLAAFGERAADLRKCLFEESAATKVLSHNHLATVYGAGEIDGYFCAAMEYIQGNSVATMLARKEGFSIWDLLDIGRQVCSGLDHAHAQKIFHYGWEPAKIMCGWDGMVRVLGFGVSSVGKFTGVMAGVPQVLPYLSPEQVRGENIDGRSNLFSLGAMFYEMVTDRRAFAGEDAATIRQNILETTPPPPIQINPKLHPLLSNLIVKVLAKDPAQRYQSGRQLLDDLEQCKESRPQAGKSAVAVKASPAAAAPALAATEPAKAVAKPPASPATERRPAAPTVAPVFSTSPKTASSPVMSPRVPAPVEAPWKSAAASSASMSIGAATPPRVAVPAPKPKSQLAESGRFTVDPSMAEAAPGAAKSVSFSEMTELPPLKEIYVAPAPPPVIEEVAELPDVHPTGKTEKPRNQPREAAGKAMREIRNVPPRLVMYAVGGAVALILIIVAALLIHIHYLNEDEEPARARASSGVTPAATKAPPPAVAVPEPSTEPQPAVVHAAVKARPRKKSETFVAPAALPGQMAVDSTPQGAQVQIDGTTDAAWVTPFTLSGLNAGQHLVTISKAGYSTDTRTVEVASGSKSFVLTHLAQLMATLAVSSTPAGANVYVDGRDTGKLTPAQVAVEKGQHVVLVRKAGFLDETTAAPFTLGQTVSFSPSLRPLGNVDDIKTVGKMKKLFGGGGASGMGTVSIRTQPKGAQVAVNQHMLDRPSPVDFAVNPGNYVIDITASGYAPLRKVVTVDRGGKVTIDETLQRQ